MSAPAAPPSSAPPPPQDAYSTNQLASSPLDTSEKPSHASSLAAGPNDADTTATTTPPSKPSTSVFSEKWMLGPVVKDYGDYGLLACSFVTGMVDGASFLNWGVFVGMQTGEFCCSSFSISFGHSVQPGGGCLVRFWVWIYWKGGLGDAAISRSINPSIR